MTYWQVLGYAALGLGGLAAFMGMLYWTFEAWDFQGWLSRTLNLVAWTFVITTLVYFIAQAGSPS